MTEDERIKLINEQAAKHLEDWLEQLENGEVTTDDLLASIYGGMVAAYLYGCLPDAIFEDAKAAAERLIKLSEESEELLPILKKCKNKDENGECPLHNLHCQYPDCEK